MQVVQTEKIVIIVRKSNTQELSGTIAKAKVKVVKKIGLEGNKGTQGKNVGFLKIYLKSRGHLKFVERIEQFHVRVYSSIQKNNLTVSVLNQFYIRAINIYAFNVVVINYRSWQNIST